MNYTKFDRLFDSVFNQSNAAYSDSSFSYHSEKNDDHHLVEIPVPGLTSKDLQIKIVNGKLEIKGGQENNRWCNNIERVFYLPKNIDNSNVKAKVENGLLTVTLGIDKNSDVIVNVI